MRRSLWLLLLLAACAKPPEAPRPNLSAPEPFRPSLSYNGSSGPSNSAAERSDGAVPVIGPLRRSSDEEFARSLGSEALANTARPESIVAAGAPSQPAAAGGKTYAIIVNGDDDHGTAHKHVVNTNLGQAFMRKHYGAAPEDVIVLTPASASRAAVLAAAKDLAGRIKAGDRLVVYTTGHGTRVAGTWALVLRRGEMISIGDFSAAFTANQASELIYIGDQCYSGGFASLMASAATASGKAVISISSTDAANQAICETFIRPFFAAFFDKASDANGDGRVNEHEAFMTARRRQKAALANAPHMSNSQYIAAAAPAPSA